MLISAISVLLAACGGQDTGSATQAAANKPLQTALLGSGSKVDAVVAPAVASSTAMPATPATPYNLYVSSVSGSDSAAGTSSAPLRTIGRAATLAKPGTTVHVGPGTYAETINSSVNGTASARIRYVSVSKWKAILKPASGAYTMWSVKGGYTDIDGFQIDGSNSGSVRVGVYLTGGNSSVKNSWVHHVAMSSGCDNRGGAGLLSDQSRGTTFNNYDFIGNVVHNVGGGCGWIQGIYHSSSGKIINNVVYATSQAINMGHDDHDILVMNNTLFNNSGYGVYYGGCQEAYTSGCPTSGIKVHNNIIYNNGGGIGGPATAEDVGNDVRNNLVYGNRNNYDLASPSAKTLIGMINAAPQFVNYVAGGGGDYRLRSTSPAIGKGLTANAPAYDIDGKPRGSAIDMGAYEY